MSSALDDTEAMIDTILAQTQSDTADSSEVVDDTAQTTNEASSADADLL